MKSFCLMLLLTLTSNMALAVSAQDLQALVQTPKRLSGTFSQEKYLATVDTTLKSSGEFSYMAGQEISWHTVTPIENTLTLTPNQIISSQNGQQISIIEGQQNPIVRVFSDIFFGVMTANWTLLEEYFTIEASTENGHWQALLTPNNANIAQAIARVRLTGDTLLQSVQLNEVNGNTTFIRFDSLIQGESN